MINKEIKYYFVLLEKETKNSIIPSYAMFSDSCGGTWGLDDALTFNSKEKALQNKINRCYPDKWEVVKVSSTEIEEDGKKWESEQEEQC